MARQSHPKRHHYPVAPFVSPQVTRFFELMKAEGVALTDCAEKSDLSVACLVKWKRRHSPTLSKFEKALKTLGYELKIGKIKDGVKS